ncbi:MAG: hypothetical protein DI586_04590 [Micavibrio aeruginosavorus]|uniref:Peptidase inhibitor I78 family protein n=1 Tax=Micavibrio aeruginosavorus TaxID=349221 RepID=A0A2W5FQR3_9BACT|nr:MAG: hypothetical protein DI586_04590 [Micavibrio aeruginosavorus]
MYKVVVLSCLLLTSCAAGETSNCAYRNLVGKNVYGVEVEAVRQSGKEIRVLYPDSFLGFEKKPGRVNVIRDDSDEIVAVTCG